MESLVIEGQRVRFCQQCGAFHDIRDFAGQRKSCKWKLAQHNERRRKAKGDKMSEEIQFEEQYINDPEVIIFQKLRSKSRSSNIGSMEVDHADGTSASIKKSTAISRPDDQKSTARNDEVSCPLRTSNYFQTHILVCEVPLFLLLLKAGGKEEQHQQEG
jgi:hypothetical protein